MKKVSLPAGLACLVLVCSCKKSSVEQIPQQQQQQHTLVTAVGTPDGAPVSKTINAATGGNINSPDGRISIAIPLKSTRTYAQCNGPVDGPTVYTENFSLGGYEQNEIPLSFGSNTSNAVIKAGSMPVETGTGAAIGLYWNAVEWPGVQQALTTKMSWAETAPKFN